MFGHSPAQQFPQPGFPQPGFPQPGQQFPQPGNQLVVEVLKGRGLPFGTGRDVADPYVVVSFQGKVEKTNVHTNGGGNPVWNARFNFPAAMGQMVFQIYDQEDRTRDVLMGEATLDLSRPENQSTSTELRVLNRGSPCGFLSVRISRQGSPPGFGSPGIGGHAPIPQGPTPIPQGPTPIRPPSQFVVDVVRARDLPRQTIGKADPYAILSFCGKTQQTPVAKDAGTSPQWNSQFIFPYSMGVMSIKVYDRDTMARDDLIGETTVDLSQPKNQNFNMELPLQNRGKMVGFISMRVAAK